MTLNTPPWNDWFNNHRLLESIGHVPPVEFEQGYYRALLLIPLFQRKVAKMPSCNNDAAEPGKLMSQPGFFDLDERHASLDKFGDPLVALNPAYSRSVIKRL